MSEYISRDDLIKALEADYNRSWCSKPQGVEEYVDGARDEYDDVLKIVCGMKAADVQPVSETENMAIISDEFICKRCGIHIKDYIKVVMDEDNDGYIDEQHYDYEPKFCPECGAEVKDCDAE